MTRASDNAFPSILLEDHVDPAAPTTGFHRLFIDTDEKLKMIDHASLVTDFTPAAGGDITADTAWVAKGDLIVGTGADAAAILTAGADGLVLTADDGEATGLKWAAAGGGGGAPLAICRYAPGSDTNYYTASGSLVDVDATNVLVTFTAPASGNVIVNVGAYGQGAAKLYLGLRESTTNVIGPQAVTSGNGWVGRSFYLTGVAAGSHTYKLAFASGYLFVGPNEGMVEMTVWAA